MHLFRPRWFGALAAVFVLILVGPAAYTLRAFWQPESEQAQQARRLEMVSTQIEARGVKDKAVLTALRKVPRHRFVPARWRGRAYTDEPLPIGEGQTISQPYIVGWMTELIGPTKKMRVLEIGTGSGYQAAVLAECVGEVDTMEVAPALGKQAKGLLGELGYRNIRVRIGDGYEGWPERAPYDAIILTAAPPADVPRPLLDQLKPGGRLVAPIGRDVQDMVRITKAPTGYEREVLGLVRFVPMTGKAQNDAAGSPAPTTRGDAMIEGYLARQAKALDDRVFDGATTYASWLAMRPGLKRELFSMLGLWPVPEKTPLNAKVTGTLERDGPVVIEKLHFQSRPGLYVTGNLYRPKTVAGKLPAVLYVCGHASKGRDGCKTAFQDHGMWYAKNGYLCLIIDTLQLGELPGTHHGTYSHGRWWWQAVGYTPAGVECWNGIRAIDYLMERADVDPARIGVTGISGGGAATLWIAAADDRVACAVPISGMSDLESYVGHKIVNRHCDCMLMVNTDGWAWTTIAALVAPRPLLFANSDADPLFPMDGNRRIIDRLRRFYALAGAPRNVAEHISHGDHRDRADLRQATYRWMNAHLKHDFAPVKDATDPAIEGKLLRAFPADQDLPADSRNAVIDETFVAKARPELPDRAGFDEWKRAKLADLRAACFRTLPEKVPAARAKPSGDTAKDVQWLDTEPGIEVAVRDLRKAGRPANWCTLIVLNEGEKLDEVPRWAQPIVGDGAVVVLAPRGVGPTAWTRKNPPNYVARAHALIGRTVDLGRVWDIIATHGWVAAGIPSTTRFRLAGKGPAGVLAAYAVLLGPLADEVVVFEPPATHRDGPTFLNVLRVLDIPEALGLLAPTRLRLIHARRDAFNPTKEIHGRAGMAASLFLE